MATVPEASYEAYVQELSQTLRRLRKAAGNSQEVMAHAAGLTSYTYQKYERGFSRPGAPMNPELKTLLALSRAFGVTVADLLPRWMPEAPQK
jgi:transcriptional regulator with XRE-family HTH domain